MTTKPLLAAAIMVKNEIKTIDRTIKSCAGIVNAVVLLDTGSTDGTQALAQKTAKKHKIELHIFEEPFVDFGTSRNRLLSYARPYGHFLLLMDANEEVRNGDVLRPILKRNRNIDVFTIRLRIMNDAGLMGMETIFQRACIINSNNPKIYYVGKIHEYITTDENCQLTDNQILLQTPFHLYQDKEKDTLQAPRFRRDVVFLKEELEKDPKHLRSLFYLGVTYRNLQEYPLAFDAFKKRIEYGFEKDTQNSKGNKASIPYSDETYMAHIHSLELVMCMEKGEAVLKSVFSGLLRYLLKYPDITRSEHFVITAGYYLEQKPLRLEDVRKAYAFAKKACELPMPQDHRIVLKTNLYHKTRWLLLAKTVHLLGTNDDMLYMEAVSKLDAETIQGLPNKDGIEYPTLPGPVNIAALQSTAASNFLPTPATTLPISNPQQQKELAPSPVAPELLPSLPLTPAVPVYPLALPLTSDLVPTFCNPGLVKPFSL